MSLSQSEHEIHFYENRKLSEIADGEIIFNAEGMEDHFEICELDPVLLRGYIHFLSGRPSDAINVLTQSTLRVGIS
jgi:hypothetical protein